MLAAPCYTPEQIAAWSSFPDDLEQFRATILRGISLVRLSHDLPVAHGQLEPADQLALLYTAPTHARQGHATALYTALEDAARQRGVTRLRTTASHLSRPLFAKQGFQLVEVEHTTFKGVAFERFRMEKLLH